MYICTEISMREISNTFLNRFLIITKMKKLVLFAAVIAVVAFSSCKKAATEETQTIESEVIEFVEDAPAVEETEVLEEGETAEEAPATEETPAE